MLMHNIFKIRHSNNRINIPLSNKYQWLGNFINLHPLSF